MPTIEVTCPDCDGRGFTRRGPLQDGAGSCSYCDRCDGRGSLHVHIDHPVPRNAT